MFYDRFLELCENKGVRPTNACVAIGLSRGLAAKWKATKTEKPSADALEKMAAYFEMSIDEILNGEKENASTREGERDLGYDDFTYAMQNETKELTDSDKELLLSMARQLNQARKQKDNKSY